MNRMSQVDVKRTPRIADVETLHADKKRVLESTSKLWERRHSLDRIAIPEFHRPAVAPDGFTL